MAKATRTQADLVRFTKAMRIAAPDLSLIRMKPDGTLEAERGGDGEAITERQNVAAMDLSGR